jgi:predicted short-subunit dehydrogenase-like oxidoreductase (DUF2520 family)
MRKVMIMNTNSIRIGFAGAGKVGRSLGRYILERGIAISGYYSRSAESAASAAEFTDSRTYADLPELMENSDIVFITVPDIAIARVWGQISDAAIAGHVSISGKVICHCSGSLASSVFEDAERFGAFPCSLHPVYAVSDPLHAYRELGNAYFTYEGSAQAYEKLKPLLTVMGNPIGSIDAENKILYHAACVFFSNLTVGLAQCGIDLLRACGLEDAFAENAWHALFMDNARHIAEAGPKSALTGPAERGDAETISKHIEALSKAANANKTVIYRALTSVITDIAKEKHPERDYDPIKNMI